MMNENEEKTMFEELTAWDLTIRMLLIVACELHSHEQDSEFVTEKISKLFTKFEALKPDDEGLAARYGFDIEHPTNPDYKLVFEFKAFFERTQP